VVPANDYSRLSFIWSGNSIIHNNIQSLHEELIYDYDHTDPKQHDTENFSTNICLMGVVLSDRTDRTQKSWLAEKSKATQLNYR